jgi:hypothetical protein
MKVPQFRVGTLMFVIWLSALLIAGAVDIHRAWELWNHFEVIEKHFNADGSLASFLLVNTYRCHYLGPIPIGPCPIAVYGGIVFVASIVTWGLRRRGKNRNR